MSEAVEFHGVSLRLRDGRDILRGVSFTVAAGSTVALLGRSGSGKTTLLRCVNGLNRPTGGRVLVGGRDVAHEPAVALRRRIGYVIQESGLFPHWDVERNVAAGLELRGDRRADRRQRVDEMLALVGLAPELLRRKPHELSGGQRQRVGLARALATKPEVLLMDEPFGALDPVTRATLQRATRELLRASGVTTLVVTHDLSEALFLADRVVLVADGEVAADSPAGEARSSGISALEEYVAASTPELHA